MSDLIQEDLSKMDQTLWDSVVFTVGGCLGSIVGHDAWLAADENVWQKVWASMASMGGPRGAAINETDSLFKSLAFPLAADA